MGPGKVYDVPMKNQMHFLALCCVVLLVGCAVQPNSSSTSPLGAATNWQIEAGTSITAPPAGVLTGALQTQGSQVTGVFSGTPLCGTPQVMSFAGTIDSSGNLTLAPTPPYFYVQLAVPANPTTVSTGTMSMIGQFCALATAPGPAVGVEIASLTGTFAGPVTSSSASGNLSLMLTQSATPNGSGQFPLTGTLTFSNGACVENGLASLAGTVSGIGLTLDAQNISVAASTNPAATQLTATSITLPPGSCASGVFSGTLARQ
jgi:hypothetical protein